MTNSPGLAASATAPAAPARSLLAAVLLILVTMGLYWPSLDGALVYDDLPLVESSPATQSVGAAFEHALEPFWAFNNQDSAVQRGIWRPMTSLALAVGRGLNDALGATADARTPAPGFHWMSLLLHIASTLIAFRLAALLIQSRSVQSRSIQSRSIQNRSGAAGAARATIGGALIALLFAVHPAQVESVAWISAINDPLWGCLGLAVLLFYEKAALRGRVSLLGGVLLFLALASKEQALVIPLIALGLDFTAKRRPSRGALAALVLPVAIWFGVRVFVFESVSAGLLRDYGDFGFSAGRELTFRLELAGGFLSNLFWPTAPAVFRPVHPVLPEGSTALLESGLWLAGFAMFLALALWNGLRSSAAGLMAAFLVILPFIVSPDKAGLFPESDRYLYVAVFGAALALLSALLRLRPLAPTVVLALAAAAGLGKIAHAHQARFANELAFRDAAVADAPRSPNVRWGAGRAYISEYLRTQDTDTLSRAYLHYLHSLKAVTRYGDGSFVDDPTRPLGERVALMERLILETPPEKRTLDPTVFATTDDRYQATLGQIYSNLLRVEVSTNPDLEYPLLLVESAKKIWGDRPELASLEAQIYLRRRELRPAKEAIAKAIKQAPSNVNYQSLLADILMREGEYESARATLGRALDFAPGDLDLRLDFAAAALEAGRLEMAEEAAQEVLSEGDPENKRALLIRGAAETRRGRPAEALRYLDRALRADPNFGRAHKERGLAMVKLDDIDGALEGFSNAARLLPEDFESHYNVASILLMQQPAADAPDSARESWLLALEPVLVRAYMLSSPNGQEQLALQQQLEFLVGNNPDRALSLATQLKLQGRNALALIWVNLAVKHADVWPEEERTGNLVLAYTLQGQLSAQAGLVEESLQACRNAVALDADHFPAQFELSDLLSRLGRLAEAEAPTREALRLLPEAGVAREMVGAVRGTLESHLARIEAAQAAGPEPPPR